MIILIVSKYCRMEFNIGITQTLQFNTFTGYRLDTDSPSYDPKEGVADTVLISPDKYIQVTDEQAKSLTNGLIDLKTSKAGGNIFLQNVRIRGRPFILPNCYVFCCSSRLKDYKLMEKLGCNSSYDIPDMSLFCNIITSTFKNKIKNISFPEDYKVKAKWEKVKYTNDNRIVDPSNLKSSDYAIKYPNFFDEGEYRLIFRLVTKSGYILSVPNKPIKLDVTNELRNCCRWDKKVIIDKF